MPDACYIPGTSTTRFGYYANIDKSHTRGLELAAAARWKLLFANANYSWIEAEDRTPDSNTSGRQLARVPRHLANAEVGVELPSGLRGSLAARYSGRTFDSASGAGMLNDYWLFDVRAQWPVTDGLILQGRIENLSDKSYQTASGYAALGRTFYVGSRSRF